MNNKDVKIHNIAYSPLDNNNRFVYLPEHLQGTKVIDAHFANSWSGYKITGYELTSRWP